MAERLTYEVVIPAFNAAQYIAEAVESALAQTLPPARVIVVDDGSEDDTVARLAPFGERVLTIAFPNNRGGNVARNTGIEAVRAPLVAFLDADDRWKPNKLDLQVVEFERHAKLGICYTGSQDTDYDWHPLGPPRAVRARSNEWAFEELYLTSFTMPPSTVLARRSALERVGLFNIEMRKAQDFELWLRMTMLFTISCIPEALAERRIHSGSLTSRADIRRTMTYDWLSYDFCAQAAQREGKALPMPVERRKALGMYRRLLDALDQRQWEDVRWLRERLDENGQATGREHLSIVLHSLAARAKGAARWLVPARSQEV